VRVTPRFAQQAGVLPDGHSQHDGEDSKANHAMLAATIRKKQAGGPSAEAGFCKDSWVLRVYWDRRACGISPVSAKNPASFMSEGAPTICLLSCRTAAGRDGHARPPLLVELLDTFVFPAPPIPLEAAQFETRVIGGRKASHAVP
jgi:hypothetical protein